MAVLSTAYHSLIVNGTNKIIPNVPLLCGFSSVQPLFTVETKSDILSLSEHVLQELHIPDTG